ncbi:MAG: TPM domain-containing protein [Sulfitobacter sp.]
MRRFVTACLIALMPLGAFAQSFPARGEGAVLDLGDLLPQAAEDRIGAQLQDVMNNSGIEIAVVTLPNQAQYAPGVSLERFATELFNDWGLGHSLKDDGILLLVLAQDRQMRLELGRGYDGAWDGTAQAIVDDVFLPAFADGDFAGGIEDGVAATIAQIAEPFAQNAPAPVSGASSEDELSLGITGIIGGIIAAFLGGRFLLRMTKTCPNCHKRGKMRRSREEIVAPGHATQGQAEVTTRCLSCGYATAALVTLPVRDVGDDVDGGGSGGSGGGGGGSGSW